ncbi:pseudouridylate synthase TRUB2, mitochondrial [Condylostylus longicornis]|uniref:pseudouridylate synthase TRUB2, mitochondrial n=1 Tax=Condylostylus longicornis TaxID=2530218 RepID=UPI00244E3712|nr:pseudouridylate synthase TRUB2, mitochondrial [Condylostylus longicornis]
MLTKVYDAPTVFKYLNGVLAVYKPAGKKVIHVRNAILHNICKELNELEIREPRKLMAIAPGGSYGQILKNVTDLSDDILAVGPRYKMEDFKFRPAVNLETYTSGVLLLGLNSGVKLANKIQKARAIRAYCVTGKLGTATENHLADSAITARATHKHISASRLASLVASLQASHLRKMYEMCGVDIQSQSAYELACQGLIRPANNIQPVIYSIKVIKFRRPYFTLEIHAINETQSYLATLIHEIGIELKSVAHCCNLQCIRHGNFNVNDTLLRKDWHLQNIIDNMHHCRKLIESNENFTNQENIKITTDL